MAAERQAPGSRGAPDAQIRTAAPLTTNPSRHPRGTAGDRPEPHAPAGPRCTGSSITCGFAPSGICGALSTDQLVRGGLSTAGAMTVRANVEPATGDFNLCPLLDRNCHPPVGGVGRGLWIRAVRVELLATSGVDRPWPRSPVPAWRQRDRLRGAPGGQGAGDHQEHPAAGAGRAGRTRGSALRTSSGP
jgi:hypothetical protein